MLMVFLISFVIAVIGTLVFSSSLVPEWLLRVSRTPVNQLQSRNILYITTFFLILLIVVTALAMWVTSPSLPPADLDTSVWHKNKQIARHPQSPTEPPPQPPPQPPPEQPAVHNMSAPVSPTSITTNHRRVPLGDLPVMGENSPIATLEKFYEAINNKRCDVAKQLRPGYKEDRCKNMQPEITKVDLFRESNSAAVVWLDVEYRENGKPESFRGFVTLLNQDGHWIIDGLSFQSADSTRDVARYMLASRYEQVRKLVTEVNQAEQAPSVASSTPVVIAPLAHGKISPHESPTMKSALLEEGSYLTLENPRPRATTILEACWDPRDLKGHLGERTIHDHLPADHSPPLQKTPFYQKPGLASDYAKSLRFVMPANDKKLVALTFDLCEQANERTGYDSELVDHLRRQNVKATFYAGGKWMRSHPKRTMQLMADPLFEIGNHAWTHGNMRVIQGEEMEAQIYWTQAQYELLYHKLMNSQCVKNIPDGERKRISPLPATFRFPYGTCNTASLQAVAKAGLYPIQWNIVSGDPVKRQTASMIVKDVLRKVRPGSIIIAHANGRGWHTAEALKTLIPALHKRGYQFVTVSELLAAGTPIMSDECYEVRPGDNVRYDRLFGKGTE